MKKLIILLLFITTLIANNSKDPYKNLSITKLKNGIDVIMLPNINSKNVQIIASFRVGMLDEKKGNYEITHLIEHLLYRDSRLPKNVTYMQLIEERGGSANGFTAVNLTSYLGTVPKEHGEWLIDTFSNMLLDRKIDPLDLPKEKKTITLEIGEPDWLADKLGFDILNWYKVNFFKVPDFEESEFGLKYPDFIDSENDRIISLQKIKYEQVVKHYNDYYYPSNMMLFVVGNFDSENCLALIKEKFGKFKDKKGKTTKDLSPNFVKKPFVSVDSFGKMTNIAYGVKYDDVSAQDDIVLVSYNSYLAHRLMKKLRNDKADTYTVSEIYSVYRDHNSHKLDGYVGISFETSKQNFWENLDYVKQKIKDETQKGKMSDEMINRAIKFYMQKFELVAHDVDSLMNLAIGYYFRYKIFQKKTNYYQILKSTTPKEYRDILKNYYSKNYYYKNYNRPKIYSKIELNIIIILSLLLSIWYFYHKFNRGIDFTKIKFIKNISHSPMVIIESLLILSVVSTVYSYFFVHIEFYLDELLWFNDVKNYLYYNYTFIAISIFILIGFIFYTLSLFPKTILVEDDKLVIKMISPYSIKVDLSEIETIESIKSHDMLKRVKDWFSYKFRYGVYDPFFWRDRLIIKLKNGKIFYLGFIDANRVKDELLEIKKFDFIKKLL